MYPVSYLIRPWWVYVLWCCVVVIYVYLLQNFVLIISLGFWYLVCSSDLLTNGVVVSKEP
jgi:uncharacterized membrane protein